MLSMTPTWDLNMQNPEKKIAFRAIPTAKTLLQQDFRFYWSDNMRSKKKKAAILLEDLNNTTRMGWCTGVLYEAHHEHMMLKLGHL